MASVGITQVRKAYGQNEVIHGIDIDIEDEEFVVLVGPSGCGKSTLLRMMAGLEQISGGEISIGGTIVNLVPPKERDIAMVFQNYALYPHMTVFDNMAFSLKLRKADPALVEKRVREAGEILGLIPYLDRNPRQLSGGQRQRVAMGRAIVRDRRCSCSTSRCPTWTPSCACRCGRRSRRFTSACGPRRIYVTHDQVEAMTMADRIVVMHDGHVEQIGTPLELYDYPANTFVAGFIGSPAMNFFEGTFRRDGRSAWVETPGDISFPVDPLIGGTDGQPVTYGIRPGHLHLVTGQLRSPAFRRWFR